MPTARPAHRKCVAAIIFMNPLAATTPTWRARDRGHTIPSAMAARRSASRRPPLDATQSTSRLIGASWTAQPAAPPEDDPDEAGEQRQARRGRGGDAEAQIAFDTGDPTQQGDKCRDQRKDDAIDEAFDGGGHQDRSQAQSLQSRHQPRPHHRTDPERDEDADPIAGENRAEETPLEIGLRS